VSETAAGKIWHKVAEAADVADGAVTEVTVGRTVLALVRIGERVGALHNRCPHAGGPLAQGSLENGLLTCPWHGREYDPFTGRCEGYAESARPCAVEARADGIYVALE